MTRLEKLSRAIYVARFEIARIIVTPVATLALFANSKLKFDIFNPISRGDGYTPLRIGLLQIHAVLGPSVFNGTLRGGEGNGVKGNFQRNGRPHWRPATGRAYVKSPRASGRMKRAARCFSPRGYLYAERAKHGGARV